MKQLTFLVVFLSTTGLSIGFHHALTGSADAARSERLTRETRTTESRPNTAERSAFAFASSNSISRDNNSEMVLARIAAECGNHLLSKARCQPDNAQTLDQAFQHYRACLAHETKLTANDPLFREVKKKLQEIEDLRKSAVVEETQAPSEPLARPAPPTVSVQQTPPKTEALMVGPDGVIIRRSS